MPEPVSAPVDFLSGDYSPEDSVNSARLSARYLARQGKPWDLMAWSFTQQPGKSGDNQKTAVQLRARGGRRPGAGRRLPGVLHAEARRLDPRRADAGDGRGGQVLPRAAGDLPPRRSRCRRWRCCFPPRPITARSTGCSRGTWRGSTARSRPCWRASNRSRSLGEHHLAGRMAEYPLIVVPEWDYLEPGSKRSWGLRQTRRQPAADRTETPPRCSNPNSTWVAPGQTG